jgi:TRAP-type C4-dicarboxylate transport system permease small subunit
MIEHFAKIIRRIAGWGTALGGASLAGMMVLITATVIYRRAGHVILGTYELSELLIVVTASFALVYAALNKRHIVVKVLVERFPRRTQAILEAVMSFISLATWGLLAWAAFLILSKRWLDEESVDLSVPFLPFRIIFFLGLVLLCSVYLIDMVRALRQARSK